MTIIRIRNIEKNFDQHTIINNVSLDIEKGERIGLVGNNGAGKTTLANIIFGTISPDKGFVEGIDKVRIGYLEQTVHYMMNQKSNHQFEEVSSEFLEMTSELGLEKVHVWEEERFSHLSGGEKLKLALATVWETAPDILILDEPTNHLDVQGVRWLVEQLDEYKGNVIIISHDRYFLDLTVKKIIEIENGKIATYNGNYTSYRAEKKKRYEDQLHHYDTQQRMKERVESQVSQLQQWAGKAHREMTKQDYGTKEYHGVKAKKLDRSIKSKMKRLEKELEKNKIDKPSGEKKVRFQFDSSTKRGKRIIEAKKLEKSFQDRQLFVESQFYINQGERIGLVGPNGSGKTTLLKILLDEEPISSGEIWKSSSLNIAYLSQNIDDLPQEKTPIEALGLTSRVEILQARTILANMGMGADLLNQPIQTLSLGERTRVKLCGMLIRPNDLLILDEPTNHLDLASREQLETTLREFSGTILVISHDVYFLNNLCEKTLVIENQQIKRVEMGLEEYEKRNVVPKQETRVEEEILILDTEISAVLGELSMLTPDQDRYKELDAQFLQLTKRKKELLNS
ncbi:ribosomal protection-like ABC-F family protein [Bacillus suaedaesalsae]|uniref:ABC-F type ribosomal protection protein n=1 Tax=Bacillus suaedaesalsae TaxID=2810349 RepID=A0ABS2DND7_9BACI|nr:ABC-F type ribosomal protection protein [Bacillus suaedaesalsae]MBM6619575.1 ABC-F type ribosomal protection protein [Bacillus suaedaesalsae]